MAELKTKPTDHNLTEFLATQSTERLADCEQIIAIMKQATNTEPMMWGSSIIGFGKQHLKYASGRELDWFIVGFSPRKANISLYLSCAIEELETQFLGKLGKFTTGKGCLYIKRLADVDLKVLTELIRHASTPCV